MQKKWKVNFPVQLPFNFCHKYNVHPMEYDSNINYSSNTHCTYLVCACVGVVERGESVSSVLIPRDVYYDVPPQYGPPSLIHRDLLQKQHRRP